jgi:hypothetical protein
VTRGWVCNLLVQLFLVLSRTITLGAKSRRIHDHILLSHLRLPQPGGPGPHIYIPQEQGGPVIPPGTGFRFVASYDSQGCGGGILTRLHTGAQIYIVSRSINTSVCLVTTILSNFFFSLICRDCSVSKVAGVTFPTETAICSLSQCPDWMLYHPVVNSVAARCYLHGSRAETWNCLLTSFHCRGVWTEREIQQRNFFMRCCLGEAGEAVTASVSSGQSSWLQIRRLSFDSRHYQKPK